MNNAMRVLVLALAVAGLSACKTAQKPTETTTTTPTPSAPVTSAPATDPFLDPDALNKMECLRKRTVLFDFDKSDIRPEFQEQIGCHATYLSKNPGARLTLEGHADERGTREYNLGLGERRANAIRDVLVARGARNEQVSVVSYGEERPTCTEHNEGCWQRNRRGEFVYTVAR